MQNNASLGQINIALFCGGRGSATITNALLQHPNVHLTLIVNAYDDGLSTGALREFISHMLGPSDFRKSLSYLLDPYSEGQYALKHLLELRLPDSANTLDVLALQEFINNQKLSILPESLRSPFSQISSELRKQLCTFLHCFFDYAKATFLQFDYRDCSVGNLIFAGAYLLKKNDFNAAAKEISQLVSSRALLVNVSCGENRILIGLKEDGELLMREAQIVSVQSSVPIKELFLVSQPIDPKAWQERAEHSLEAKISWLREQECVPNISPEAEEVLTNADIILFGPGTQHSSLLPSYRISEHALKTSKAKIKALIMNLGPDHDIQSLSASQIIDNALRYMNDVNNQSQVITHVLLNEPGDATLSLHGETYKNIIPIRENFANACKPTVHNGRAVAHSLFALWEKIICQDKDKIPAISIFIDIHNRSLALTEFYEELLEIDWKQVVGKVYLSINQGNNENFPVVENIHIKKMHRTEQFPELGYFTDWLHHEDSEYLILITGDGKYYLRDAILAIQLLNQGHFGAVFGSRTQSRVQFQNSLRAAYGERKTLSHLSFLGSFVISALFAFRCGTLFSDPLTGFRLFKRSRIAPLTQALSNKKITTPINLATYLIKNKIEIAELPITFRTFAGFVDPKWRIRRGIKNLLSTLRSGS